MHNYLVCINCTIPFVHFLLIVSFPFNSLPLILEVGSWALRIVLATRELVEKTIIKLAQLWAAQSPNDRTDILVQQRRNRRKVADNIVQCIWNTLLQKLKAEASEVVAGEECLSVVDSAREVGKVDASESVDFAGVTAEFESAWICEVADCDIADDVLSFVGSVRWTAVPVFWNALLAWEPFEVAWAAASVDTEE